MTGIGRVTADYYEYGRKTYATYAIEKKTYPNEREPLKDSFYKQVMEEKMQTSSYTKSGRESEAGNLTDQIQMAMENAGKICIDGEIWMNPSDWIAVMDVDDGYATIEIDNNGVLSYMNRMNKEACWSMEITQEQLEKAKALGKEYAVLMSDQSFWETYLNEEVSLEELDEMIEKAKQKEIRYKILDNFAEDIRKAWEKAKEETGIDGLGIEGDENTTFVFEISKRYIVAAMKNQNVNFFGDTAESALEMTKEILMRLEDPRQPVYNSEWQELKDKEKDFYQKFAGYLEQL